MAGLIAGCITITGLASTLINAIVNFAGDATIIGLVLTMLMLHRPGHGRSDHRQLLHHGLHHAHPS